MNTPSSSTESGTSPGNFAYAGSLYFLSVGILHLWGYWAPFGINILEYASLADIIKTTAYPIASTFVFFAVGTVLGELFSKDAAKSESTLESTFWQFVRRHSKLIGSIYMAAVLALLVLGPTRKWLALPMLLTLPVYVVLRKQGVLERHIQNETTRSIFLFLVVALPLFAYGQGRLRASDVLDGKAYTYLQSAVDGVKVASIAPHWEKPRYLGQAGDYLFFFHPTTGAVTVVRFDHAKAIELAKHAPPDSSPLLPGPFRPTQPSASQAASAPSQASRAAP